MKLTWIPSSLEMLNYSTQKNLNETTQVFQLKQMFQI